MKNNPPAILERIRHSHSLMYNPELSESAPVLRLLEKNTFENLLNVAENAQLDLPNLVHLGSKEDIKSRISQMPQRTLTKKNFISEKASFLSVYFKNLYLQATEPEFFGDEEKVLPLKISVGQFPKIDVFPSDIVKIEKFPSTVFTHFSPVGKNVELLWFSAKSETLQRTLMDYHFGNRYRAMLLLEYGDYHFACRIGKLICPPINYSQKLRFKKNGIFAFFENKKAELLVLLNNPSRNAAIVVLKSKEEWLNDTYWMLPPLSRKCVVPALMPWKLKDGINETKVSLECLPKPISTKRNSFSIKLESSFNNAFPVLRCRLTKVSRLMKNKPSVQLVANVSVQGTGSLSGTLLIPQIGSNADFKTEDGSVDSDFEFSFAVPDEKFILCGEYLKVILVSDSYYANMRFQEENFSFQKVYLKKSIPALVFNDLPSGSERTLRLSVRRTDGRSICLKTEVPIDSEKYLKVLRRDDSSMSFLFNSRHLRPGTNINEVIGLIDTDSGLRATIKIIANITNG